VVSDAIETQAESYWLRGCSDAKEGKEPAIPFPFAIGYEQNARNEGYMNGWRFGRTRVPLYQPSEDEGSQP
jgi:hypothetical protein